MNVFYHILKIFLVLNPFSWIRIRIIFVWIRTRNEFFPEPDPYQSLSWIRIRNEFFHILDPYQNDTDPQHSLAYIKLSLDLDPDLYG